MSGAIVVHPTQRPLQGVRVLALEAYVAGPLASMMLADWGGDVVKVEPPHGDPYRYFPPVQHNGSATSNPSFVRVNRNKRSIVLDLKNKGDRSRFLELVSVADVVLENQRAGALERLGVGFETLADYNPQLVCVSISGFGQPDIFPGPLTQMPAFDLIGQARSGMAYVLGEDGGPPVAIPVPLVDTTTADWAATAVLLGLRARDVTGQAQHMDVSMYDVAMHVNEMALGRYAYTREAVPRGRLASSAPLDYFRAQDGWFALAISGEAVWHRFCAAIGQPQLVQHPALINGTARALAVEDQLRPIIEKWAGDMSVDAACEVLLAYGVPASPVDDARAVLEAPHARARRSWIDIPDPVLGDVRVVANPLKSRGMPTQLREPAPQLDADADDVWTEWLSDKHG